MKHVKVKEDISREGVGSAYNNFNILTEVFSCPTTPYYFLYSMMFSKDILLCAPVCANCSPYANLLYTLVKFNPAF
jgi:hypothetical protein